MKVTDEFFETSDLDGSNFFPDDDLTRIVISGFLARNYIALEPSHFLDHPDVAESQPPMIYKNPSRSYYLKNLYKKHKMDIA